MEEYISHVSRHVTNAISSVDTYNQIGVILAVYLLAYFLSSRIHKYVPILREAVTTDANFPIRSIAHRCGKLIFPILALLLLRMSIEFSSVLMADSWVMQVAFALALLLLYHSSVHLLITNALVAKVFRWIGMPIILFYVTGVLDDIVRVLESMSIELGNIRLSAYGLVRTLIFGSLLFWLGRVSNSTGQTIIRKQKSLDFRTREIVAKLFEIMLFFVVVMLILQLMGINLTTLAVFGGALGVGLGFGLQAVASNFISGVIIIFDRSISVGDYIEMEDGRTGTVTELNMRSTTLETYDGKDIVVPNEKFINSSFVNWTHKNIKQRYRVDFSVAYKTDVRSMVTLVKEAVAQHPKVLAGPDVPLEELPDCEIDSFGDSGINMFVEFWIEGIDDGRNRVGGDLMLIILETLQQNNIEIPFPQREVKILNPNEASRSNDLL